LRVPDTTQPSIHELDRAACEAILARHSVGRVAFTTHNRVDIEPLHYAFVDGWIYGRTSPGRKLDAIAHRHWVAFEVDEVAGPFDWRSVVVHGGWYGMDTAPPAELARWERGVDALRALVPGSFTKDDPVPFRSVVFGIQAAEITGRECLPR
jgi:nitroimidazol reductase NimA-like FMN-containing flavoprotein (pyridoxamine 5'-phosphate oxidase superfamily)